MHPVLRRQFWQCELIISYGGSTATKIWVELGPSVGSLFNVLTFATHPCSWLRFEPTQMYRDWCDRWIITEKERCFRDKKTEITRKTKLVLWGESNGVLAGLEPHTLQHFLTISIELCAIHICSICKSVICNQNRKWNDITKSIYLPVVDNWWVRTLSHV